MRKGIPYNPPKKGAKVICLSAAQNSRSVLQEPFAFPLICTCDVQIEDDDYMAAEAAELTTSSRCQIDPGNKRGCIRQAFICTFLQLLYVLC